jgi:class 3 adenylate cyclase
MGAKEWMAIATGVIGLLGTVVAVLRYFIKKEQLEGELKQLQDRYSELGDRHKDLLQVVTTIKSAGSAALLKKSALDADVEMAMNALQAKASSILVPLPHPNPASFVFLTIHGPAASKIRRSTTPINKGISGYVYAQAKPYLAVDARSDPKFFKAIDKLSDYQTTDILCVPLVVAGKAIAVLQFLNKVGGDQFTQQDLHMAERFAATLTPKVQEFTGNPDNFELLGFSPEKEQAQGTIIFCDLTASSSLMDTMDRTTAIGLINVYLERNCDIALRHGATVDKFIGDGAMFRFNVPHSIQNYASHALQAAIEMREEFESIKASWLDSGFPVSPTFTRVGVASGPLAEAIMGHPQYQSLTVMGEPVVIAANLCAGAPRDRNIVVIDQASQRGLESKLVVKPLTQAVLRKVKGSPVAGYELLEMKRP